MARLLATDPFGEALPIGGATQVAARALGPVTLIAPFKGQTAAVSEVLRDLGLGVPDPGEVITAGEARMVWSGLGQAMLVGVAPPALTGAMVMDMTGAVAAVTVTGPDAADIMARVVPMDLRGIQVARTLVGHMQASVLALPDGFEIWVPRSMALTLVHELSQALTTVTARQSL